MSENSHIFPKKTFSVAPMMGCTDRHDRYLLRLISKNMWLYTEMVVAAALIHGDAERFLAHDESESPVALQLGGSDPKEMAEAAYLGESAGYDEINMNVGCPSDRVKSGKFGACLMLEPERVGECVAAMVERVSIPVTVKCRLGVDDRDSYEALTSFVQTVVKAGCPTLFVHARKAWLAGLSPKQNREIPPLDYDRVYRLKRDFPNLEIVLNGGLNTLSDCNEPLNHVDGVMIGRNVYTDPYIFAEVDRVLYGSSTQPPTRKQVLDQYLVYVEENLAKGVFLKHMSRHLLGLYYGLPGARHWRRVLSEGALNNNAGLAVIHDAYSHIEGDADRQLPGSRWDPKESGTRAAAI